MATFDLFSKRRKRAAGETPDVYTYEIPESLRVQIIHIWSDAIGSLDRDYDPTGSVGNVYRAIADILRREYGVFVLDPQTYDPNNPRQAYAELCAFFLDTKGFQKANATDKALDVIELSFRMIDNVTRSFGYRSRQNADEIRWTKDAWSFLAGLHPAGAERVCVGSKFQDQRTAKSA